MKKSLLFLFTGLLACASAAAAPSVKSGVYYGAAVSSISDNGNWMVCEMDQSNSVWIFDLANNLNWMSVFSGDDGDIDYTIAFTRAVSDEGTVVGEVWNVPSVWKNGVWTNLPGWVRDDSGYVYCAMGAITPDGSMIVGSLGKGGGSLMGEDDDDPMEEYQMTYPCVWYRQADGTYGEPVFLPNTGKDFFGRNPQYVNCIAVSQDGKTIGAMMRSGSGYFHFPLAYTLNDNGEWELKILGMNLVNPKGYTPSPWPGDYWGPEQPNYEPYMTSEELSRFYREADEIAGRMQAEGKTEEEITLWEIQYAMNYMSPEKQAEYKPVLDAFLEAWTKWDTEWKKYEESMEQIMGTGFDFEFNNIRLSPDGKYIYSSAKAGLSSTFTPVRIDIESDTYELYPNNINFLISDVTSDYSILGHEYNQDTDFYRTAYIFPKGDKTPVPLYEYYRDKKTVYDWMEDNMYRSVVVSVTPSGNEQYDDRWCMGKPVSTPDMSLLGFAASSLYWENPPTTNEVTFLMNVDELTGVEGVVADDVDASLSPLRGGIIEVKGELASVAVYDLTGTAVFTLANPSGLVSTGLPSGIYVVKALKASGEVIAKKALF